MALPSSTIGWSIREATSEIPIEERPAAEVEGVTGRTASGEIVRVQVVPAGSAVANPAFDVTPARLISGLITERGRCPATAQGLAGLFPEHA